MILGNRIPNPVGSNFCKEVFEKQNSSFRALLVGQRALKPFLSYLEHYVKMKPYLEAPISISVHKHYFACKLRLNPGYHLRFTFVFGFRFVFGLRWGFVFGIDVAKE